MPLPAPGELDAIEVVRRHSQGGLPFAQVRRLPTDPDVYTYEVTPPEGEAIVVRLGVSATDAALHGAAAWSTKLRALGVPVPEVLAAGSLGERPYLVLARPPGERLATAYVRLRSDEKRGLARELVRLGRSVRALPAGAGFGFVTDARGPFPFASWDAVVRARLASIRKRLPAAPGGDAALVDRLEERLPALATHLGQQPAKPFLGGSATVHVLVHQARLSAIVEVDRLGYGDPLHAVGRTRAALLARRLDTVLADYWCEEFGLAAPERRAVAFYTAVFAADLLTAVTAPVSEPYVARLRTIVAEQLAAV